MPAGDLSLSGRARQAWTIAKVELRRVFFARRGLWVYGLALLPAVIFFGHGVETKFRSERLARRGLAEPALLDSIREGETVEDVKKRLGTPAEERWSVRSRRVRQRTGNAGTTTHVIEPAVEARFVRLNVIRPSYSGDSVARIYEFEVYGPDGPAQSRARPSRHGSLPCSQDRGPEKAVNGSVAGGEADSWCARRQALVPAGGSWRDSPGDALRREARQRRRRERGVRHPRVQHPGEHGRKGLHHGRDVVRRRVRRGTDRVSRRSSTSTGGGRPGSCSSTASWSPGTSTAC